MNRKGRSRVTFLIFLWLLPGVGAAAARGQRLPPPSAGRRIISTRAQSSPDGSSITFLTAPDGSPVHNLGSSQGVLNLGSFSYATPADGVHEKIERQKDSFAVSTKFDLRIGAFSPHLAGTATVSAYLVNAPPLETVWLDGVRLSMTPAIIGRQVSYGVVTEHVLKIEIPISMRSGEISDSIGVVYSPN